MIHTIKNICLILILTSLVACGGGGSTDDEPSSSIIENSSNVVEENNTTDNLDSTDPTNETNSPEEPTTSNIIFSAIPLTSIISRVQPMTGIVFWTDNDEALNALSNSVQLEFSYMTYNDIIEEAGVYNWQLVDQKLDAIAARGHQAILRFRYSYPGETRVTVPAYIANATGYNMTVSQVEGANTFLPDWNFQGLETFTLDFFQAFAERYDGDPRLAILQVGFGSYAEYHLHDGPFSLGDNFPSKSFQTTFLTSLENNFQITHWAISIDASENTYSPFASDPSLNTLTFGLFDDSFMHQTHSESDNEYNRASWLFFGTDRYTNNPMGGEFSYYTNYDQQNVLSLPNGPHGRNFESFADQYHISYMLGNDQYRYQPDSRIHQASMATGYKFNIDSFEASSQQSRLTISNTGIAPIYYDAYPSIDDTRSSTSLKGLLPGESRDFLVEKGGSTPTLTIESDYLVAGQQIDFSANL
jgi:hypothetical protein